MQFDRDKFKSLLHYVIWKTSDRAGFGTTKLYKVLWFSDARAFMLYKEPITGETYIREKYGPMPRHAAGVLNEMRLGGLIRIWNDRYFNKPIRRFASLEKPDRLNLTDPQRQIVEYWITHIADDHTAASISEETHDQTWEIATLGEELPYAAIFATRARDPEGAELDWAKSRAKELGLP
ncbi:MAG: Panacea domain-containing protein [Xanthobacteraceae bacterium]